ncbi:dual specificity protein phosphatase 14-like protein [Dinothrombium tinctorium]|uniref:Dual specificity protein phosphatase 14-like protein n=1 Tax=Dinothrombium tinctorium TaxID=1965070 RepID=A0A443QFB0_9ACAR|nr:dual specificity protein phosphatase 14-like protein [Dinothrombium tinctorium]
MNYVRIGRLKVAKRAMERVAAIESPFGRFSQVLPYLFLTGVDGIREENIRRYRITCIVNTTVEVDNVHFPNVENFRIALHDRPEENIVKHFDAFADKIEEVHRKNGIIVVHCFAGCSRSATVVIAYLMKYKRMTLREAFYFVRDKRSIIRPNCGFFEQLIAYEKRLFGKTTVKMVLLKGLDGFEIWIPDVYADDHKGFFLFTAFSKHERNGKSK